MSLLLLLLIERRSLAVSEPTRTIGIPTQIRPLNRLGISKICCNRVSGHSQVGKEPGLEMEIPCIQEHEEITSCGNPVLVMVPDDSPVEKPRPSDSHLGYLPSLAAQRF